MSETEVHTIFEGIQPASCYGWFDDSFKACTTECKVSKFCQPATVRRQKGVVPNPVPPPPPAPLPEPLPEPAPLDYLLDGLRGKSTVERDNSKSNANVDIYRVTRDSALVAILGCTRDGSNRVKVQTKAGANVVTINTIEAAESLIKQLS